MERIATLNVMVPFENESVGSCFEYEKEKEPILNWDGIDFFEEINCFEDRFYKKINKALLREEEKYFSRFEEFLLRNERFHILICFKSFIISRKDHIGEIIKYYKKNNPKINKEKRKPEKFHFQDNFTAAISCRYTFTVSAVPGDLDLFQSTTQSCQLGRLDLVLIPRLSA